MLIGFEVNIEKHPCGYTGHVVPLIPGLLYELNKDRELKTRIRLKWENINKLLVKNVFSGFLEKVVSIRFILGNEFYQIAKIKRLMTLIFWVSAEKDFSPSDVW